MTDPNKLTKDYQLAYDLYNHLSASYKVFFSERSLDNIVIREYEPNIYHALYTAKIMLVLCSDIDYLNSQWVRNEWSRFKMMTRTSAQAKSIIPIFIDGFAPEQLPDELRSCQGYNNDIYLMQKLGSAIKAIINPVDKEAEIAAAIEAKMNAQMEARMQAQMEALAKQFAGNAQNSQNPTLAPQPKVKAPLIPLGTTEIAKEQFRDRQDLTSVVIPNGVTKIGYAAFMYCSNLADIVIPDSVTEIESDAFYGTEWYRNEPEGILYAGKVAYMYRGKMPENTSIALKKGTISIAGNLFCDRDTLVSLNIPEGVIRIGAIAFSRCTGLKSVTVPKSLKTIGASAFHSCENLTDIYYSGTKAEWASIKKREDKGNKWDACTGDYTVHCTDGDIRQTIVPEGTTEIADRAFANRKDVTKAIIPNGVIKIGGYAFDNCTNLTKVEIPNTVTSIGSWAFSGCTGLTSITIPQSVAEIDLGVFKGCTNLSSITVAQGNANFHSSGNCIITTNRELVAGCKTSIIPTDGSVTIIGFSAFLNCSELTEITIPDSVTYIGGFVFEGCTKLLNINFTGTKKQWKKIDKYKDWDRGTGKYIVHCTDGDVKKSLF